MVTLPRDRAVRVFALSCAARDPWLGRELGSVRLDYTAVGPWTDRALRLVVHAGKLL